MRLVQQLRRRRTPDLRSACFCESCATVTDRDTSARVSATRQAALARRPGPGHF
jgi:hypothetical protein